MMDLDHDCDCEKPEAVGISGTVNIGHAVKTNQEAADYGAYATYALAGTEAPFRVLPYDEKRSRAVIQVDASAVYVGKKEQIFQSGNGWKQATGMSPLELRNKQEVWIVPTGVTCNVMVLNERWAE
jgi:hypothetical protein